MENDNNDDAIQNIICSKINENGSVEECARYISIGFYEIELNIGFQ